MDLVSKKVSDDIKKVLDDIPIDFGGGCSFEKACMLAYLISISKKKDCIEIGVYRGRSFFPQAVMLKYLGIGMAYGIDPYTKTAAMEYDDPELKSYPTLLSDIETFVEDTSFEDIYKEVLKIRKKYKLEVCSKLIRKKSVDAAKEFEKSSIGLLHIDGNHDNVRVKEDLYHYLPLLTEGGFLVMDDISWKPIKPLYEGLKKDLIFLYEKIDQGNDFAVFYYSTNRLKGHLLKRRLNKSRMS